MPTKFFLMSETAPYTPGSFRGSWDQTAGAVSRHIDPFKFGSASSVSVSENTATTPFTVAVFRGVSRRLAAQTISGTVDMVIGLSEANVDADYFTRLHLYVVKTSDDSVVGTLLNGYTESAGGGATEWPTTAQGVALQSAQALTSVVVPSDGGDYRLVMEMGYSSENSHTTARNGTIRFGGDSHDDEAANTLTVGGTQTARFGYLEFSGTVSLASDVLPNVSWQQATAITSFPHSVEYNLRDGGYTYSGYYKFTATRTEAMGAFGFGDTVTYRPTIRLYAYSGAGALPTETLSVQNRPTQFGVTAGTTYYLYFQTNASTASPAVLDLVVQRAPTNRTASNAWLINEDTGGFPAAVVSASTGEILALVHPFPAGEGGDRLENGTFILSDQDAGTLKVYDRAFTQTATVAFNIGVRPALRAHHGTSVFYAGDNSNPAVVKRISSAGVIEATETLTGNNSIDGLAVNTGRTIIYHGRGIGNAIKRWQIGSGALSDLIAAEANYRSGWDLIYLEADDTILASYYNPTSDDFYVRLLTTAGAITRTYSIGTSSGANTVPRIAFTPEDPTSFLAFWHPSAGTNRVQKIRISDGTVLSAVDFGETEGGVYQGAESASAPQFSASNSCPIVPLGISWTIPEDPPPLTVECCPCDCPPPVDETGKPVIEPHAGPILPPVDPVDFTPDCTGGGAVPTASDATDPESWVQ